MKLALQTTPALPGGDWSDERTVGGTTALGVPVTAWDQLEVSTAVGWPGFAKLSAALPLVRRYEDLGLPQPQVSGPDKTEPSRQEIVRRWMIGLFSTMVETAGANPTWLQNTDLKKIWAAVTAVNIPLSNTGAWDAWLEKGAGAGVPAAKFYPELIAIYNAIPPNPLETDRVLRTRPPRFEYRPNEVIGRRELFDGGLPIDGRSYLHALWTELANQVKRADGQQTKIAEDTLLKVAEACGRFFGFGERLAWPQRILQSNEGLRRFMVLRQKLDNDWGIVNGVSLAGLVFRIDGILQGTKLTSVNLKTFEVQLPGATSSDVEPWKTDDVAALVAEAVFQTQNLATAASSGDIKIKPEWKVAYAGGGTRTDRAVYWKVQEGALQLMEKPSVPEGFVKWHAEIGRAHV